MVRSSWRIDMVIKYLDLEPKIDDMMRNVLVVFAVLSCGKRIEYGNEVDGVGSQRHHIVPIMELNGVSIAFVARSGVISKSTDRIFVSHG
ncbi:hypothetical protein Tco_1267034, partial [Tanacetum coccineum]